MKLAAIDIGSNAIRLQITNVLTYKDQVNFKKMEYVRFPLRLGHDVFTNGKISGKNERRFIELMRAFKILIDLYEVEGSYACATSAMRESKNGREIIARVKKELDLEIHIIEGELEAELINKSLSAVIDHQTYVHIDVGGGSTEFNVFVNQQKVAANSFKIGSVRRLEKNDLPEIWNEMEAWLKQNVKSVFGKPIAIGTGGNIGKAHELAKIKPGKPISMTKLEEVKEYLSGFDQYEKTHLLLLNPDRADVIVPALEIYIASMKWSRCKKMIVPDVGLKDGLVHLLYERTKAK